MLVEIGSCVLVGDENSFFLLAVSRQSVALLNNSVVGLTG